MNRGLDDPATPPPTLADRSDARRSAVRGAGREGAHADLTPARESGHAT